MTDNDTRFSEVTIPDPMDGISLVFPSDCKQCAESCFKLHKLLSINTHCVLDGYKDHDYTLCDSVLVVNARCEAFPQINLLDITGTIIQLEIHENAVVVSRNSIRCSPQNLPTVSTRILNEYFRLENEANENPDYCPMFVSRNYPTEQQPTSYIKGGI